MNTPEPYLTTREVAALLKVSPRTVQMMAKRGQLPHYRIGDKPLLRFSRLELLECGAMELHTAPSRAGGDA